MLTGTMVPTVWMESAWMVGQVSTALSSFTIQRILPAFILAAETVILTLILHLLVLTRTAACLAETCPREVSQVTTSTIVNHTTQVCFNRAKNARSKMELPLGQVEQLNSFDEQIRRDFVTTSFTGRGSRLPALLQHHQLSSQKIYPIWLSKQPHTVLGFRA